MRLCVAFVGTAEGFVDFVWLVSCVLSGSKVSARSVRIESMHSSIRRASSTRRAGVSRTEVSEAPSSFGGPSDPAPEIAPATLENMLRSQFREWSKDFECESWKPERCNIRPVSCASIVSALGVTDFWPPERHWTAAGLSLSTTVYLLVSDTNRGILIVVFRDSPTFFFQGSDLCVHFLYLQSPREIII
jgi:hypothetical protein